MSLIHKLSPLSIYPYYPSSSPSRLPPIQFYKEWKKKMAKNSGISTVQKMMVGTNFPKQFLLETTETMIQLFQTLSDPQKQGMESELTRFMSIALSERYIQGLRSLNGDVPVYKLKSKPSMILSGLHFTYGPWPHPQDYVAQEWDNMTVIVPAADAHFETYEKQAKVLQEAQEEGCFILANVIMNATMEFSILRNQTPIYTDTRYQMNLEFMSPHFNPWDELYELDSEGEWDLKWKWKLCDIDYLLKTQPPPLPYHLTKRFALSRKQESKETVLLNS